MGRRNSIELKQLDSIIEQRINKGFRPPTTGKHKKGKKYAKNNGKRGKRRYR